MRQFSEVQMPREVPTQSCKTTIIDRMVNGRPQKDLTFQGAGAVWVCDTKRTDNN